MNNLPESGWQARCSSESCSDAVVMRSASRVAPTKATLVVFGAADPKAGALGSLYHFGADPRLHHGIDVRDGVRADEAAALLKEFFAARRLQ